MEIAFHTLPGKLLNVYIHPDGRWMKVYHLEKHFGGPKESDQFTIGRNDVIPDEWWNVAPEGGMWSKVA